MSKISKNYVRIDIGQKQCMVMPTMSLICQIEDEVGGIPYLLELLQSEKWKVLDIVTLVHMMLAETGTSYDYHDLGNRILKEGVRRYHEKVVSFLNLCLMGICGVSGHSAYLECA